MGWSFLKDIVMGAIQPLTTLIDELHTSKEEKLLIKERMLELYVSVVSTVIDYEQKQAEMKAQVIMAEANAESWLTKSWRPLVMLIFTSLVVLRWCGVTIEGITPDIEMKLFDIIELGLGGYVIGRSAEKVIPAAIEALKSKDKT